MAVVRHDPSTNLVQFKKPAAQEAGDAGAGGGSDTSGLQFNNAGGIKERIEEAASREGAGYSADDMKYAVAVKTAQDRLADSGDLSDDAMKQEIDRIYEQELGAGEGAGRAKRGENGFTDVVGGIKDFIDNTTLGAGNLMDGLFDNTIGNIAGLVGGEEYGQSVKDAFDGSDLQIVADIASDVALSAIPGAGIPLVLAKNAFQNADNFAEAISGVDNVTLDNLDGWQRFGKGAEAVGSTALSAIPGIGKARNLADYSKAVKETNKAADAAIAKAAEDAVGKQGLIQGFQDASVGPAMTDFLRPLGKESRDAAKQVADKLQPLTDAIDSRIVDERTINPLVIGKRYADKAKAGLKGAKDILKPAPKETRETLSKAVEDAKDALSEARNKGGKTAIKSAQENLDAAKASRRNAGIHPIAAAKRAGDSLNPYSGTLSDRIANQKTFQAMLEQLADPSVKGAKETAGMFIPGAIKSAGANAATLLPMMAASGMAEYGGNPIAALTNSFNMMAEDPEKLLMSLVPLGARGTARKAPSLKGKPGASLPYPAVRAGAVGDEISRIGEGYTQAGYGEDEIMDRLAAITMNGENDG